MTSFRDKRVLVSDASSKLGQALAAAFVRHGARLAAENVDVLVNIADPSQDYRVAFESDFFGPLDLMQSVLPRMIERRSGLIINVCSTNPAHASKFALEGMSRSARIELHRHKVGILIVKSGFDMPDVIAAGKIFDAAARGKRDLVLAVA